MPEVDAMVGHPNSSSGPNTHYPQLTAKSLPSNYILQQRPAWCKVPSLLRMNARVQWIPKPIAQCRVQTPLKGNPYFEASVGTTLEPNCSLCPILIPSFPNR